MRASRNTLSAREVEYYLSGRSEFGFLPVVVAVGKGLGKTVRNVAVNAQAGQAGNVQADNGQASITPVKALAAPVSASSAIPFLLASTAGLGLGLLAGYMVGHARST